MMATAAYDGFIVSSKIYRSPKFTSRHCNSTYCNIEWKASTLDSRFDKMLGSGRSRSNNG